MFTPKGQVLRVRGASFAICGKKKSIAPHSVIPFYPVFKAVALTEWSHDADRRCFGDCLRVVWSSALSAAGNWHTMQYKQSMSLIHARGASGPSSRKLTSLELAFGQRWAIFMMRKPNSYHPVG